MGCAQSKIENEESVARCKERKKLMKDAVAARNAFAAAHSCYAVQLKQVGAALSEYGQSEVAPFPLQPSGPGGIPSTSTASVLPTQPPMENLRPPPLPDFSPPSLQRSVSMPDLPPPIPPRRRNPNKADASIREEEDDGNEEAEDGVGSGMGASAVGSSSPAPPPPLPPQVQPTPSPPPPRERPAPPPPPSSESQWDFFFQADPMQGSLGEAEEIQPVVEDVPEEEHFKRPSTSVASSSAALNPDLVGGASDVPPVTPEKTEDTPLPLRKPGKKPKQGGSVHHQHATSVGVMDSKKGRMVHVTSSSISLVKMLSELDDHFLKASESAQEVTKMLEATRLHYHSNFADNRGHIDHSARVLKVITWNRSFKNMPQDDGKDDDDDNENSETHATILDKLLAWEKKLYDEVKAGELMKIDCQRKLALLNKQKKRNASPETLEKTKATVSHLHTRYIVDMQSMDSTVSEIQRLRDDKLYHKLVALVDGMAKMWESMHTHHDSQLNAVIDIRTLDISCTPKETTQQHYNRTEQLYRISNEWHVQFGNLVHYQKEYILALNHWLKLNLIPVESSLKEKVSSPQRVLQPPIQALVIMWADQLEKLPHELAKTAIAGFARVIDTVMLQQKDELNQKHKCDEIRKDLYKKERAFDEWNKHSSRTRAAPEETETEGGDGEIPKDDSVVERQLQIELLKKRLEEDEEELRKLSKLAREKAVGSLKSHLPDLCRSMKDFALACSEMYKNLRTVAEMQRRSGSDA